MQALLPIERLSPPSSPAASPGASASAGSAQSYSPVSSPLPFYDPSSEPTSDGALLGDELSSFYQSLELKIAVQPPAKTVYQRILKPFPSVMLVPKVPAPQEDEGPELLAALANAASGVKDSHTTSSSVSSFLNSIQHAGLFVEASLVRSDTGAPVTKCLDGNSMARFERSSWNGGVLTATFKKLKILSTSQQLQGALLRLKFTLKKYTGTNFATVKIPGRTVLSQPIEIFSHSQYLNRKEKPPKQEDVPVASSSEQAKPKTKRIDPRDKVHLNLITAIRTFKERGGTKEMLAQCIDACFDEEPTSRRSASWEITMENLPRHPPSPSSAPSNGRDSNTESTTPPISATTTPKNHDGRQRRNKDEESSVQPCLPPIREQLGTALVTSTQSTQAAQPAVQTIRPKSENLPHASVHYPPPPRRGSLPESRVSKHPRLESAEPPSAPQSTPSKILPSLSTLSLLPPTHLSPVNSTAYSPLPPQSYSIPAVIHQHRPRNEQAPMLVPVLPPYLHHPGAAIAAAAFPHLHALAAHQAYSISPHNNGDFLVHGKRKREHTGSI